MVHFLQLMGQSGTRDLRLLGSGKFVGPFGLPDRP